MSDIECPICKTTNYIQAKELPLDAVEYKCARCGDFRLTGSADSHLSANKSPDFMLSAWVREHKEKELEPPYIETKKLESIRAQFKKYNPTQKQSILLQAIERKSKYPGSPVNIYRDLDFPLCWATSEAELDYYLRAINDRKLIQWISEDHLATITPKGWEYLEDYSRHHENMSQVFVAMSFSAEMESVWGNAIKPGIENAGYQPYRIDKNPHNERIDMKIMDEIKKSKFLVADFTGNKHGVYFEAGYALGLGIPVIWSVRDQDIGKVHFDTNHYNHIKWKTEDELKGQLTAFINVIIPKHKMTAVL